MTKSAEAFRTIAEVATTLGVAPHVLRFWEQRFSQVSPLKRAGGRRYYRPTDVALLAGLKQLLHDEGLTIRGAQKRLSTEGVGAVQAIGSAWLVKHGLTPAPAADTSRAPVADRTQGAAQITRTVDRATEVVAAVAQPAPADQTAETAAESPEPRRRASTPRRPAPEPMTLPLFPELEPEIVAPAPAPAAVQAAPSPGQDATSDRLSRLTAALRRCDQAAGGGPLAPELAEQLATLARDLRALCQQAAPSDRAARA